MNIYYLKDHLYEELNGAQDYLKKAMHIKEKMPKWSKTFYDMAQTEMEHATNLYKMFCEYYDQINNDPKLEEYMVPFKDSIDEAFIERVGAFKYMQELYNK